MWSRTARAPLPTVSIIARRHTWFRGAVHAQGAELLFCARRFLIPWEWSVLSASTSLATVEKIGPSSEARGVTILHAAFDRPIWAFGGVLSSCTKAAPARLRWRLRVRWQRIVAKPKRVPKWRVLVCPCMPQPPGASSARWQLRPRRCARQSVPQAHRRRLVGARPSRALGVS